MTVKTSHTARAGEAFSGRPISIKVIAKSRRTHQAARMATQHPSDGPTASPRNFAETCEIKDNWTISSGRLAWKRPRWVPKNGKELALRAALRAYKLPAEDVSGCFIQALKHVHITWRDAGHPGEAHRPIAILNIARRDNFCTEQPATKTIILDYHKAPGALPPVWPIKIVFVSKSDASA